MAHENFMNISLLWYQFASFVYIYIYIYIYINHSNTSCFLDGQSVKTYK